MKGFGLLSLAAALLIAVGVAPAADKSDDAAAGLKCPISGKACVAASATKYKDGEIVFCCTNCPKTFAKSPDKFAAKANMQLVASGQYVEVKCPLTGRPLNAATATQIGDVEIAVCCNGCKGKLAKADEAERVVMIFSDKAFEKGFEKKAE